MILPLEKQVVCKDLAEKLKKNGYKQEGLWWWVKFNDSNVMLWMNASEPDEVFAVAPTVAELGNELPGRIMVHSISVKEYSFLECRKWVDCSGKVVYCAQYSGASSYAIEPSEQADTEANARAKIWLYLKKEGLFNE